ncbi:MAG: 5'-3' exonuclease H3TH domain-containing protein, partial [Myxococcota bacterium]
SPAARRPWGGDYHRAPEHALTSRAGPVLLLDAMSLLFRSFYALPPMNTSDGRHTNALYGISSLFIKIVREHRPSGLAFAVDLPRPTFRHLQYAYYKAGRPTTPDPLAEQVARFGAWMGALGVPVHAVEGFEADDVIATLADQLHDTDVLVVSGDTDLFQVVTERVSVWYVGRRQKDAMRMDLAAVRARYGVEPRSIPTVKALVGDPSDNLPGLPGIGAKTATRWIVEHGDAAGIVAAADRLTPARHRDTVASHAEGLVTWESLATVRRDVPLEGRLQAPLDAASFSAMDQQFEALEFRSLRPRLAAVAESLGIECE